MRRFWISLCSFVLAFSLVTPAFADTSYTVQPGDTLARIAVRFNVSIDAIVRANQIKDPNAIRVGQVLIIPDGQPTPAPTTPPGGSAATPAPSAPAGNTYIVRPGDSVTRVANKFGITIDELIRANNLTTTTLQIGQVLVIPGGTANNPPPANSVYERVTGTASFVRRIHSALDWLQANDADAYNRANTYISLIRISLYNDRATASPMQGGGCLVRALARSNMPVEMVAALLYHEATHCMQFATVGSLLPKAAEVDAYKQQIAFMERHGFSAETLDYYRRILAYYESQPDDARYIPPPNF